MTDIYDTHQKAFAAVSAYVVINSRCEQVAKVAFRYPGRNGLRLWAYVHFHGVEMVRGKADGGGYDKASAAVEDACRKLHADGTAFADAILKGADGAHWDNRLRASGFQVLQAV